MRVTAIRETRVRLWQQFQRANLSVQRLGDIMNAPPEPYSVVPSRVRACKMAEIHEVIEALPQGYQTAIGEHGVGLSGGQKQRLAIARALLKQPRILIFDEATSSLDANTAEHFAATINQLKGKATMLFVSHALPKNLQVDEIVRIGGGALSAVNLAPVARSGTVKRDSESGGLLA